MTDLNLQREGGIYKGGTFGRENGLKRQETPWEGGRRQKQGVSKSVTEEGGAKQKVCWGGKKNDNPRGWRVQMSPLVHSQGFLGKKHGKNSKLGGIQK